MVKKKSANEDVSHEESISPSFLALRSRSTKRRSDTSRRSFIFVRAGALFLMIGATANTNWLPEQLERDPKGYIFTGRDLSIWPAGREPFALETNLPGVFCADDVRHGSIKRVGSGVGEGSMSISFIHEYLGR